MSVSVPPPDAIHYPDSDGKPMSENDWQRDVILYAVGALKARYAEAGSQASHGHGRDVSTPTASPEISPTFVARARRCRCDKAHGPKDAEGVVELRRSGLREYALSQRADPRPQQKVGEISGLTTKVGEISGLG